MDQRFLRKTKIAGREFSKAVNFVYIYSHALTTRQKSHILSLNYKSSAKSISDPKTAMPPGRTSSRGSLHTRTFK